MWCWSPLKVYTYMLYPSDHGSYMPCNGYDYALICESCLKCMYHCMYQTSHQHDMYLASNISHTTNAHVYHVQEFNIFK